MQKELSKRTEAAMCALYQNREHEAIQAVAELLPIYQEMIRKMLMEWGDNRAMFFFEELKRLVENYQAQDMLGMADCIYQFALPMIKIYGEKEMSE